MRQTTIEDAPAHAAVLAALAHPANRQNTRSDVLGPNEVAGQGNPVGMSSAMKQQLGRGSRRRDRPREAAAKLRSIKIPFDPATESLTIHWIRIWRAGEDFSLLEQVEDLEITSTEDGRKVAQFTMADLRPDDCIDI